jgi:hypothetical protein
MADITAQAMAKRLVDEHLLAVLMLRVFVWNHARECALGGHAA